jgi:hypothetical protein
VEAPLIEPGADPVQPAPLLAEYDKEGAKGKKLANKRAKNDLGYGRLYAHGMFWAMVCQAVIADVAFYFYGFFAGWNIPVAAVQVWLAATVVQMIGVVFVIVRYLFSTSNREPTRPNSG